MKYRHLGRSGLRVSTVSLGSWLTMGNTVGADDSKRLVQVALDLGINLLDTADVYKIGDGEKTLGQAIRGVPRHEIVVASKCFFPMSEEVNDRGLSRKHIFESIDKSLTRLGTDYLDLYQCHRFDEETPIAETARAMDDLIRLGKVLYWGLSQWPAERIAEVTGLCNARGHAPPISNQPLYNLYDREIEGDVLAESQRCGLGQIVFSPLAQGVLTGKYPPGGKLPKDSRAGDDRQNQFIGRYLTPERLAQAEGLTALAQRHGHTPGQVALAFCLRDPRVTSVIVGARSEAQLRENAAAADLTLSPDLLAELDKLFPA